MAVEIVYETHATTTDNEAGVATGWLPGELSADGREQARQLGQRHRASDIAAVFVSDLRRAVQTAQIAFGDSSIPIHTDPRLRECNYGTRNGTLVAQLDAERRRHIDQPWPGGQSYRQVVEQTRELLQDLAARWDGHTILLIAHSANRWALDHLINGEPLENLLSRPFQWQPGWRYTVPTGWHGENQAAEPSTAQSASHRGDPGAGSPTHGLGNDPGNELTGGPWRALTADERNLLDSLLSQDFDQAETFRSQVPATRARPGCGCGCGTLELAVTPARATPARPDLRNPLPGEADVLAEDGTVIGGLILFHNRGWLSSLEVYTWQEEPLQLPRADQIRLQLHPSADPT